MKKIYLLALLNIFVTTFANAFDKESANVFNNKETIYVLRDENDAFLAHARVKIEWWENDELPVFIVKNIDGHVLTHGDGEIEFFGGTCKLILRQFDGKFIAHTDIYEDFCYLL